MPKNVIQIVTVVFDFDLETLKPRATAQEYSYFFEGVVKERDVAVALSPRTNRLAGVLVVNTEPQAAAVRRATKSLVGVVDLRVFQALQNRSADDAKKQALERYVPGLI